MAQYFINFDNYLNTNEVLTEWTPRWASSDGEWFLGEKNGINCLSCNTSAIKKSFLSYNLLDGVNNNVEIVLKTLVSNSSSYSSFSPRLKCSGEFGSENGMIGSWVSFSAPNNVNAVFGYINGTSTSITTESGDISLAQWFWIRAKFIDNTFYYKSWLDSQQEPVDWIITNTFSETFPDALWHGIGTYNSTSSNNRYCSCIGFGTDGDEAPKSEILTVKDHLKTFNFSLYSRRIKRQHIVLTNGAYQILTPLFFNEPNIITPTVYLRSYTKNKISDEIDMTTSIVTFNVNVDIEQWEARATINSQTPTYGVGVLVGSGSGITTSNTDINFDVDYTELTNGDGTYQITIYVNLGGVWYG